MSDGTEISWSDSTWNPTLGCTRVSAGCDSCYAITSANIRAGNPHPKVAAAFAGLTERRDGRTDWTGRINLLADRLTQPLTWKKPRRIFVNSMSDLFADEVPDEFIHRVFAVMAATPQHTYQVLTKRHARMRSMLRDECRCTNGSHQPGVHFKSAIDWAATPHSPGYVPGLPKGLYHQIQWPLPNVHIGVSVEDQKWADIRIPALRDTPAAVRWLSCEPLLGPVDLTQHLTPAEPYPALSGHAWDRGDLGWIVVGGESGRNARPMHPEWARQLRDQSVAACVPFHFKQWGEWGPAPWAVRVDDVQFEYDGTGTYLQACKKASEAQGATHAYAVWAHLYGHDLYEPPHKPWSLERTGLVETEHAPMRRWGKKVAGRELDGRTWDEFPRVAEAVSA